jgi:hypothetical protein
MTKRSMKSRNGEISDVVYVQLTIVCCYFIPLKSKVELFVGWARARRAGEMKTVLLLLKLFKNLIRRVGGIPSRRSPQSSKIFPLFD